MKLRIHRGRARHSVRAVLETVNDFRRSRRAADCAPYLVALLLLVTQAARAQTAEDFFNGGAQLYISNNIPAALERTESGLKLYPNDVKLKKLEELLKQQQQQSQQNQQQNQQNQSQQKKNPSGQKNQKQQNQQPQEQQAQNQSQQQKQPQPAQSSASPSKEKQNGPKEPAQAMAGKQMSPEEAKRLLDAQKGDEQFLQMKPPVPPRNSQEPIEDW